MTYRAVDTAMWCDPFVEGLSPEAKLLFVYLITNTACTQCGIYVISYGRIQFETGLKIDESLIKELFPKVEFYPDDNVIWVKNFFRRQCQNRNFVIGAVKCLASVDPKFHESWIEYNRLILEKYRIDYSGYGIQTVCIPIGKGMEGVALSEQNRTEQNRTVKDSGKKPPEKLQKCKKNGFKDRVEPLFLDLIVAKCDTITKMPQQNGHSFNPYQFVQSQINESQHPQAIIDGLDGLIRFWGSTRNPWSYGKKIVKINSQNYMEREHMKETEKFKGQWSANDEVLKLIRGIGKT